MASARQACSNALRASSRVAAPGAASRRCFAAAARPGALSSSVYSHATVVSSRWRVAAIPAPRFYSSGSDDYHKTSATGSKLWDFEQVAELAKDPKDVVIVGMSTFAAMPIIHTRTRALAPFPYTCRFRKSCPSDADVLPSSP